MVWGGLVRVDVNEEMKLLRKCKRVRGCPGVDGQDGCERRIEVIVKIQKKKT